MVIYMEHVFIREQGFSRCHNSLSYPTVKAGYIYKLSNCIRSKYNVNTVKLVIRELVPSKNSFLIQLVIIFWRDMLIISR